MKRITAIFLALLIVLCGCGKGKNESNVQERSEVTVRFYSTLGDERDSEITGKVMADFTAENSNITLYYTSVSSNEAYKLSLSDGATYRENAPDIVYAPIYALGDKTNEYLTLEEIRSYIPGYAADMVENALLRDSSGTPYGVSVRGEGRILVVNTDLAADTSDLLAVAEDISKTDIALFADNALDSELFFEYLMTVYTNSEITPDTPQKHWVDGFELFSSLVKMGAFAPADAEPAELFMEDKAVFAVLSESEAASLVGENYRCAAFFGGFEEGFFVTKAAASDPLKRQAVSELLRRLLAEKESYCEGYIPTDASGVFFTLEKAYKLTPCEEKYGIGCWDEVLSALTRGDEPQSVLDMLMNPDVSGSDV